MCLFICDFPKPTAARVVYKVVRHALDVLYSPYQQGYQYKPGDNVAEGPLVIKRSAISDGIVEGGAIHCFLNSRDAKTAALFLSRPMRTGRCSVVKVTGQPEDFVGADPYYQDIAFTKVHLAADEYESCIREYKKDAALAS